VTFPAGLDIGSSCSTQSANIEKQIITYRRPSHTTWEEFACAENIQEYHAGRRYYSEKDASVPIADKPDF
jgi:hypothetical protein